VKHYPF